MKGAIRKIRRNLRSKERWLALTLLKIKGERISLKGDGGTLQKRCDRIIRLHTNAEWFKEWCEAFQNVTSCMLDTSEPSTSFVNIQCMAGGSGAGNKVLGLKQEEDSDEDSVD